MLTIQTPVRLPSYTPQNSQSLPIHVRLLSSRQKRRSLPTLHLFALATGKFTDCAAASYPKSETSSQISVDYDR